MKFEYIRRIQIVHEIVAVLGATQPVSIGYSGSLANRTVQPSSDIDLVLVIPDWYVDALFHHSHFRHFFQIYPEACQVRVNFANNQIDVIRASGCYKNVWLNCEIYSFPSLERILGLSQPEIKIVRKITDLRFMKTEWSATDNLGESHVFNGIYKKFNGSWLLARESFRRAENVIALGPDLDRILSAIFEQDPLEISDSIHDCWQKIFSIIRQSPQFTHYAEQTILSKLFFHPPRFIPVNIM